MMDAKEIVRNVKASQKAADDAAEDLSFHLSQSILEDSPMQSDFRSPFRLGANTDGTKKNLFPRQLTERLPAGALDDISILGMRVKTQVVNTNVSVHAITSPEDNERVSYLLPIERSLLSSAAYPQEEIFAALLKKAVDQKKSLANGDLPSADTPRGPMFATVFSWLVTAAQCQPSSLLPSGEVEPVVDRYTLALQPVNLPELNDKDRKAKCYMQLSRVVTLIGALDLTDWTTLQQAWMAFALSRLSLDEIVDPDLYEPIRLACRNLLIYGDIRMLDEFGQLVIGVKEDDIVGHSQIVLLWRAASSNVNQGVAARLTAAVLVHHSERGEVELSSNNSWRKSVRIEVQAIADTFGPVFENLVKKNEVGKIWWTILMVNSALAPELLYVFPRQKPDPIEKIRTPVLRIRAEMSRRTTGNLAILDVISRTFIDRLDLTLKRVEMRRERELLRED